MRSWHRQERPGGNRLLVVLTAFLLLLAACEPTVEEPVEEEPVEEEPVEEEPVEPEPVEEEPVEPEPVEEEPLEEVTIRFAGVAAGVSALVPAAVKVVGADTANGLNLDVTPMPLDAAARSVILGQLEAGVAPVFGVPHALAGTAPDLRLVAPGYWMHGWLLALPDTDYESLEDLRGETIAGFSPASSLQNALEILAAGQGFDFENDFGLLRGDPIVVAEAVRRGEAAAGLAFPPAAAQQVFRGEFRLVFTINDEWHALTGGNMMAGSYSVLESWADENPEAMLRLQKALAEGVRALLADDDLWNHPDIREILAIEADDEVPVVRDAIRPLLIAPEDWGPEGIQAQIDIMVAAMELDVLPDVSVGLLNAAWEPTLRYAEQ